MAGFSLFSDLPTEIRLKIWIATIPDDEEEVCLCWPGDIPGQNITGDPLNDIPTLPLTVDTGFPMAMHICRESRALIKNSKVSGVRFRPSRVAGCMTPFRCFRPELDVLYLSHDSIFHLDLLESPEETRLGVTLHGTDARHAYEKFINILRATRRLAVHIDLMFLHVLHVQEFICEHAEAPEHLTFVIPSSTPIIWKNNKILTRFVPPGKRCRLVTLPSTSINDDSLVVEVLPLGRGPTTMPVRQALFEARRNFKQVCTSSAQLAILNRLTIKTKTFVEYQRDGTWQEVCADRLYGRNPAGTEFVPVNRRPNPEYVRVHDADAVFNPPLFPIDVWGAAPY